MEVTIKKDYSKAPEIYITNKPTPWVWKSLSYFNNYKRDYLTFYEILCDERQSDSVVEQITDKCIRL